jgi:protein-S-isoprenylcysteine O-methyltransferase Ste14
MIDQSRNVARKSSGARETVKTAVLVAVLLLGVLLARPVLKPWLNSLGPGLRLNDWPLFASFVPWIAFSLYWEIQSKNSAPAVSSESKASRSVHLILTNLALLLIIFPIRSLSRHILPDALMVKLIGLAFECAGVTLAIWARRILGRNWSGEITIKKDHELIRSGPYRSVRHPIYSGLLLMYTGTATVSGQTHALIGLLLAIIAYLRKTRMEEANLVNAFGTRYGDYREETWAIIPGIY